MKNLKDIVEGLLDMDEEAADKAVIDSATKKLLKDFNSYNPRIPNNYCYDALGREVKIGDIIFTEVMEAGIVIGFGKGGWSSNKVDTVYFSRDGEMYDDYDNLQVSNIRCGDFIKIPNFKVLKELLKK